MLEPFGAKTMYVLLRFARWDDVLRLPAAGREVPAADHAVAFRPRRSRTRPAAMPAEAERERGGLQEARKAIPPDSDWGYNKARDMLAVTDAVVDALDRAREARRRRGDRCVARAVSAEDMLNYNEPADWFYPTRESLGAALLRAKRYPEAEQVFRDDLVAQSEERPVAVRAVADAAGSRKAPETQAVEDAEKQFRRAWKNADVS